MTRKHPPHGQHLSLLSGSLGLCCILGCPLLMLYAMYHYPLQDNNNPIIWRTFSVGYAASFVTFCLVYRHQLAAPPKKGSSPGMAYFLLMLVSVVPAMALMGLLVLANGALDAGPPQVTQYAIKYSQQGYIRGGKGARIPAMLFSLQPPSGSAGAFRVAIALNSYRTDAGGMEMIYGDGFLGQRWVARCRWVIQGVTDPAAGVFPCTWLDLLDKHF